MPGRSALWSCSTAASGSGGVTVCRNVVLDQFSASPATCGIVVSFQYPYQLNLPFSSLSNQQIMLKAEFEMQGEELMRGRWQQLCGRRPRGADHRVRGGSAAAAGLRGWNLRFRPGVQHQGKTEFRRARRSAVGRHFADQRSQPVQPGLRSLRSAIWWMPICSSPESTIAGSAPSRRFPTLVWTATGTCPNSSTFTLTIDRGLVVPAHRHRISAGTPDFDPH